MTQIITNDTEHLILKFLFTPLKIIRESLICNLLNVEKLYDEFSDNHFSKEILKSKYGLD